MSSVVFSCVVGVCPQALALPQISGHKGGILHSWRMQERCYRFFTSQLFQHFQISRYFRVDCTFLQLFTDQRVFFKFARYCCSLFERHIKRATENQLASIWAVCAVFKNRQSIGCSEKKGQRLKETKDGKKDEVLLLCKAVARVHWPHLS